MSASSETSEHRRVVSALARSEARLREAERMVGVGSWELDIETGAITFSDGLAALIGACPVQGLDLGSYHRLVHPDDLEAMRAAGAECRRTGSATCEYRIVRADGEIRTLVLRAEMAGDGRVMRGASLDVTAERAAQRERDAAAHLFREGFDASPIGMSLTDPETGRFLRVNEALCRFLARTREELVGSPVAGVIHPEHREAYRRSLADVIAGRTPGYETERRYPRADGSVVWGLLHVAPVLRADGSVQALHAQIVDITERKEREARLQQESAEVAWLRRIRTALDEDRLELFSQPIVDLRTGQTVQHELLLRMRAPDGAIVAPGAFLPAAERYGLISEIDRWVIRRAAAVAATGTPAEFNLSARSIGDPGILEELSAAIRDSGADPRLLVVEVTETAFLGQIEAGRAFAHRVRELGCRLALDDFGTGCSSLAHLKHLPADHLKIDIEFVSDLLRSETDARVVRGIVALAREFRQTTIAEGVEDEATLQRLRELGVDQAQGYLLGRPEPWGAPVAALTSPVAALSGAAAVPAAVSL